MRTQSQPPAPLRETDPEKLEEAKALMETGASALEGVRRCLGDMRKPELQRRLLEAVSIINKVWDELDE
jgi:signal transduction histidine kinase